MALTHTVSLRNAIANLVAQSVDAGSVNPNGRLVIFDAGNNVISTYQLQNPSFGAAVNGTIIANAPQNDLAPVAGRDPARFEVQDCNGAWVFRGSCGPSGDLGSPFGPIISTQTGTCTELVYNAPL